MQAFYRFGSFKQRERSQAEMLANAASVFVGAVTSTRPVKVDSFSRNAVEVRVLGSIKGPVPSGRVWIQDEHFDDCGPIGGGTATDAKVGDYVIVSSKRMRGGQTRFSGITAKEAALPRIRHAVDQYAPGHGEWIP